MAETLEQQREQFEKWAVSEGFGISPAEPWQHTTRIYAEIGTDNAWDAWRAAYLRGIADGRASISTIARQRILPRNKRRPL